MEEEEKDKDKEKSDEISKESEIPKSYVKSKNRHTSLSPKKIKKKQKYAKRFSISLINPIKTKDILIDDNSPLVDLCLFSLNYPPKERTDEHNQNIISYLKSLPSFMNIISKEQNMKLSEELINQISKHLHHEYIPKNNIVCQYGEKGEKFYIILKGRVNFIVPKPIKCYLNFDEYMNYLIQLRKNNEYELINNLLAQNRIFFPIDDDDLDTYITNTFNSYQKYVKKSSKNTQQDKVNQNEEKFKKIFSKATYLKMEELINKLNDLKTDLNANFFEGKYSPSYYIKSNSVLNKELPNSNGRQLVTIYEYEEQNYFENGQNFGYIALQNKNSKRTATAIVTEDCDLGVLTKEEYLKFFEIISLKEKHNLFELLKLYNIFTTVSDNKFIKSYCHHFEYVKFLKNSNIMEINKIKNDIIFFSSGLLMANICMNVIELNNLIIKLKTIRGKILGLSRSSIEKQLVEKAENNDLLNRKNYMSSEHQKILLKKYNFTLSIISNHYLIGFPDTVDPFTHTCLFDCVCLSAECEGYLIVNKSAELINKELKFYNVLENLSIMRMEYNISRLQGLKKEILSKIKKNEKTSAIDSNLKAKKILLNKKKNNSVNPNELNKNISLNLNNKDTNFNGAQNFCIRRNSIFKKKIYNNKKLLLQFKLNSDFIENNMSIYKQNNKFEDIKTSNNKEKNLEKTAYLSTFNKRMKINNKNIFNKTDNYFLNYYNKNEKSEKEIFSSYKTLTNNFNIKKNGEENNLNVMSIYKNFISVEDKIKKSLLEGQNKLYFTNYSLTPRKTQYKLSSENKKNEKLKTSNDQLFKELTNSKIFSDKKIKTNLNSFFNKKDIESYRTKNYSKINDYSNAYSNFENPNYESPSIIKENINFASPSIIKEKYVIFSNQRKRDNLSFSNKIKGLKPIKFKYQKEKEKEKENKIDQEKIDNNKSSQDVIDFFNNKWKELNDIVKSMKTKISGEK